MYYFLLVKYLIALQEELRILVKYGRQVKSVFKRWHSFVTVDPLWNF